MEHIIFKYGNTEPIKVPDFNFSDEPTYYYKKAYPIKRIIQIGCKFFLTECITHGLDSIDVWQSILEKIMRKKLKVGIIDFDRTYISRLKRSDLFEYFKDFPTARCHHILYNDNRCSMSSAIPLLDAVLYAEEMSENYMKAQSYLKKSGNNDLLPELESLYFINWEYVGCDERKIKWLYEDAISYIQQQINQ